MSNELISIIVLVAIFVIGTTMPINMGVLGIVAAFAVGTAMDFRGRPVPRLPG